MEPVCHFGEVDAGLDTKAWFLDFHLENCVYFWEFEAEAEYISLDHKKQMGVFVFMKKRFSCNQKFLLCFFFVCFFLVRSETES